MATETEEITVTPVTFIFIQAGSNIIQVRDSSFVTIEGLTVTGGATGILLQNSDDCKVLKNVITDLTQSTRKAGSSCWKSGVSYTRVKPRLLPNITRSNSQSLLGKLAFSYFGQVASRIFNMRFISPLNDYPDNAE